MRKVKLAYSINLTADAFNGFPDYKGQTHYIYYLEIIYKRVFNPAVVMQLSPITNEEFEAERAKHKRVKSTIIVGLIADSLKEVCEFKLGSKTFYMIGSEFYKALCKEHGFY